MTEQTDNSGQSQLSGQGGDKPASRFDIAIAGLRLILPVGVACEYFSQAIVYPVPRAPRRLLGMMHLRGQAVPVFDTQAESTDLLPIVQRCQLIVLRSSHEAVGLICDRPPRAVLALAEARDAPKRLPLFEDALLRAYQISDEDRIDANPQARLGWAFDLPRLIECCLADDYDIPDPPAQVAAPQARPLNP